MKNYAMSLAAVALLLMASAAVAQSPELEAMMDQVRSDYLAMRDMTAEERAAYRANAQRSQSAEEQRLYQQAFKLVRPELPALLGEAAVSRQAAGNPRSATPPARAPGTNITYDTGVIISGAGVSSQMLGNRFDSGFNANTGMIMPVETTGTITQITFDMINTFFGSVVFSVYSNIAGTAADQVTSMAIAGIMTGLNTLPIGGNMTANQYQNGTFLAGIWQFDPTMTGLAVDTGTTAGQGFKGISLNDGAMGTGLTTVTSGGMGVNAIFRVSGNVLQENVPVELIDFTIDREQN